MYTVALKGDWEIQKSKLKEKFTTLTDADLAFTRGKKDEMLERLQVRFGMSKQELRDLIEAL
jgi:uncharacterized protein YjbJ (UPF0337 family)